MVHHNQVIDLKKSNQMAVNTRRLSHGMRAASPALLPTEDREFYNQIHSELEQKYKPEDPYQDHLVLVVAMGILKQHRVWQAEAAMAIELTAPPQKPDIPEDPYPPLKPSLNELEIKTPEHPENLRQEKRILKRVVRILNEVARHDYTQDHTDWLQWYKKVVKTVQWALLDYPLQAVEGYPQFNNKMLWKNFHEELRVLKHPWELLATLNCLLEEDPEGLVNQVNRSQLILLFTNPAARCEKRLQVIGAIEEERCHIQNLYQQELAAYDKAIVERNQLLASPIGAKSQQILKYAAFNEYQLNGAISKLENILTNRDSSKSSTEAKLRPRGKTPKAPPTIDINAS